MTSLILEPETVSALEAVKGITSVTLAIFSVFFISDVYGFFRKQGWIALRKDSLLHRQNFWLRIVLFANTLISIVTFCIILFDLSLVPFSMGQAACDLIMKITL